MRDADDDLQRLDSHESADIDNIADRWVAVIELNQDVGGVVREDAKRDDWSAFSQDSVYRMWNLLVIFLESNRWYAAWLAD
jgi:hypothetical protein